MEMSQGNSYIGILNKNVFFNKRMQNRRTEQVLSGGWYQWEGGRCEDTV
jgi:hypothetical protein